MRLKIKNEIFFFFFRLIAREAVFTHTASQSARKGLSPQEGKSSGFFQNRAWGLLCPPSGLFLNLKCQQNSPLPVPVCNCLTSGVHSLLDSLSVLQGCQEWRHGGGVAAGDRDSFSLDVVVVCHPRDFCWLEWVRSTCPGTVCQGSELEVDAHKKQ